MAFHHSPRIVSEGLVFAWDIPNKRSYPGSGTTITNLIASGENVTISNATVENGSDNGGGSVAFDGSGDKLSFPSTTFADIMTFSVWHKARTDTAGYGYLFSNSASPYNGLAFNEGAGGGSVAVGQYYYYNGSSSTTLSTAGLGQNNVWGNVTVVFNSTSNQTKFYFNGQLNTTTSITLPDNIFNQYGPYQTSTHELLGELAICNVYNRELSATEILQNYNAMKGRFE